MMKEAVFTATVAMETELREQIEDIIHTIQCPKNFECYTSGFTKLCRARDIGLESFVACLGKDPFACKFSIRFGGLFFCQCALRVCISKKLRK
jgi:hypothetical protein